MLDNIYLLFVWSLLLYSIFQLCVQNYISLYHKSTGKLYLPKRLSKVSPTF